MKRKLLNIYTCILLLVILTIVLFCINLVTEKKDKDKEIKEQEKKEEEKYEIEYKANETIRVKISKTGEIVAMDINDYLRGVVPSEMPPYYNIEALKAQAIVARTYTYKRIEAHAEGENADICDNYAHCQAYYNKEQLLSIWEKKGYDEETRKKYLKNINEAVVSTEKQVITYEGSLIKAFFHASSPERTENVDQIWGGEKLPYLVSVENEESLEYANRTSTVTVSFIEFLNKLKENNLIGSEVEEDVCNDIKISEYTTSGRVKNIEIAGTKVSAEKLRTLFSLRSTNFTVETNNSEIIFNVIGNGHGVGLSQVGADFLASQGKTYEEIIKHYYTGVEIVTLK